MLIGSQYTGFNSGAGVTSFNYSLATSQNDYNLATDLSETRNLAAQMPQRAKALRDRLDTWRKRMGAQLPTRKPTG